MNADELAKRTINRMTTTDARATARAAEYRQHGYFTDDDGRRVYPIITPGEAIDFAGAFFPLLLTGMDWSEL